MELVQCSASLPKDNGQCNSCNALQPLPRGSGQWNLCNALPHCSGATGSGTAAMQYHTTKLLQIVPHCLGAGGSATLTMHGTHCHTALGQWEMEFLKWTTSAPGGRGNWNSYHANALPQCRGAVGSGTLATRRASSLGDGDSCRGEGHCLGDLKIAMRGGWGGDINTR